jgi:protoporphyrinogen oxidase
MVASPTVVVLGGGLSGVAAAYTLARSGITDITIVESSGALGGLAGSFERGGHFYPLGYHHILNRDRPLHFFLDRIGALTTVRWRRIRMAIRLDGLLHELGTPVGFARLPLSAVDKVRFARMMVRAFRKQDWSDWLDRSAAELVDSWAGPAVREALFEPLCHLKFELPCRDVSGAWLGARLHYREGSAPFGYIPGANWTKVLCDGLTDLLEEAGVNIRLRMPVVRLKETSGRITAAELSTGETVKSDRFVSTIPTEVYLRLVDRDDTPQLAAIRYSALISVVCATRQTVRPEIYWTNLASPATTAAGIFQLQALNPTIGRPGDACVNFVTHLQGRDRPLFTLSDDQLVSAYLSDFREVYGFELKPFWTHVARVPMYSPVFTRGFCNPPVRSASWRNLYFAGNYRTFPSIASTGTALASGLEAGAAILEDLGLCTDLPAAARSFRLRAMPRA